MHGGFGLIMGKVPEEFWIPKLRTLAKKVLSQCYGCKRFNTAPEPRPLQGNLPKERTERMMPFDVVGIDYRAQFITEAKTMRRNRICLSTPVL